MAGKQTARLTCLPLLSHNAKGICRASGTGRRRPQGVPLPRVRWRSGTPWLIFTALDLIDLAAAGQDHTSAVIAATLLLIPALLLAVVSLVPTDS